MAEQRKLPLLLHALPNVHSTDADSHDFSHWDGCVCEGTSELLVQCEGLLPGKDNGRHALPDRLPAGLRQHCVLDDVPAERLFTVRHVPDPSHTNVTGGPVARTTHWGSHLTTGVSVPGTSYSHPHPAVQWILCQLWYNTSLPPVAFIYILRQVLLWRSSAGYLWIWQGHFGVWETTLLLQ